VCTACEIRSSIRFHERMIEAAGFFADTLRQVVESSAWSLAPRSR
jgi:hypothetical protein